MYNLYIFHNRNQNTLPASPSLMKTLAKNSP